MIKEQAMAVAQQIVPKTFRNGFFLAIIFIIAMITIIGYFQENIIYKIIGTSYILFLSVALFAGVNNL